MQRGQVGVSVGVRLGNGPAPRQLSEIWVLGTAHTGRVLDAKKARKVYIDAKRIYIVAKKFTLLQKKFTFLDK